MRKIALSYRREDSEAITGRLFDRLAAHFGREAVFRDIDSIQPGADYRVQVEAALATCEVLVAVIGRSWRGPVRGGQARIVSEADPVRIEIEMALRQRIPIIPVLVGATRMPEAGQLPEALESLVYRHACRVDPGEDFDHHADRLVREVERAPSVRSPPVEDATSRPEAPQPKPPPSLLPVSPGAVARGGGRDRAPPEWGGYARSSLSHYPGTYLVVRPAFKNRQNIYGYLVEMAWDEEGGGLVFHERSRTDTRHTQRGSVWIPSPSDYLYLVSGQDGWLRAVTLSFLDDENEMRGIVSTLHNSRGALYVPVAAPIVFVKIDDPADVPIGELTPDDPGYAAYRARLERAVADGAAQLITL